MSKINIILLDKLNNTKEETNMIKPVTYQKLLEQLRKQFKIYLNILWYLF